MNTPQTEQPEVSAQVVNELVAILKQPYKDVCDVCEGSGQAQGMAKGKSKDNGADCTKCKGSGHRLLKLL